MLAMQLQQIGTGLQAVEIPIPTPAANQVLIKVNACAVCRTDLHVVDGDLTNIPLPIIPGHQVVGTIVAMGNAVNNWHTGDRIGVSWLGSTCNTCSYCTQNQENLCDNAMFTGYTLNGGFAEYCVADADYCFQIPSIFSDIQAAPLLCAGMVGYRSYNKAKNANKIGFYGFGSAAHILLQLAKYQNKQVYVFTRSGDVTAQKFAQDMGADWVGSSLDVPPQSLDAAIIFAPVGDLIPKALAAVSKGGIVICGGIHMSLIPSFSYDLLWGERTVCSVANLTRHEGIEFLELASKIPVKSTTTTYPLLEANKALQDLRDGAFSGTAVLVP